MSLTVQRDGPLLRVTLARPHARNALDDEILTGICDVFTAVTEQFDVRVVILAGQGPAFCGGADRKHPPGQGGGGDRERRWNSSVGARACAAIADCEAVTIAQLHGPVVGGGVSLAVACDLRVASEDTVFSLPEVDLGVPLTWGTIPRLINEIGLARARELTLTCAPIDAGEAHRLGLVHRVAARRDIEAAVTELALDICAKPTFAVHVTKSQFASYRRSFPEAWPEADFFNEAVHRPPARTNFGLSPGHHDNSTHDNTPGAAPMPDPKRRTFRAFLVEHEDGAPARRGVRLLDDTALDRAETDALIEVAWSGINYKDNLAASSDGKVARISPLIPGIDLAGVIAEPGSSGLQAGDEVIVHGYDTGVSRHGGFAELVSVPGEWIVPLPGGLSTREAMVLGTAGFTAALSVDRIERHGITPADGPILVTGASGGVASAAVAILARRGYNVVASTAATGAAEWLRSLGATDVIDRAAIGSPEKALQKERWAAAVDSVGGAILPAVLSGIRYGGIVAASGNAGGASLASTVFPFILRGVTLAGIDSVQVDRDERIRLWGRVADDLRPVELKPLIDSETDLDGLDAALNRLASNAVRGRILVRVRH
jgi:acrylyl-CoA reductase (NADPH)